MNRKLYEAAFFGFRSKIAGLTAELDELLSDTTPVHSDSQERVEDSMLRLVQLEGALHTLQEKYEESYKSPALADLTTHRWQQLELKLAAIEQHLDPEYPPEELETSLSQEDLLLRSPTLRKTLLHSNTNVEVEEYDYDEDDEDSDDNYDEDTDEEYDDDDDYDEEGEE